MAFALLAEKPWQSAIELSIAYRKKYGENPGKDNLAWFLRDSRRRKIVLHRTRSIRPNPGYTVEDVLRKVEIGTGKLNSGVIVYEYKAAVSVAEAQAVFDTIKFTIQKEKKPRVKSLQKRKFTQEQILYVKLNPDKLSCSKLATILNTDHARIQKIQKGIIYRDFDISQFSEVRDEVLKKFSE